MWSKKKGRCAMDAAGNLIQIVNNLPVVDYSRNDAATRTPIERCPTGAIVWLQDDGTASKGRDARKVLRKQPLPAVST